MDGAFVWGSVCVSVCVCVYGGQMEKHLPAIWETQVRSLGWEDPLEKEMATHSSTLGCKIPWTEEPGKLQSMGVTKSWTWLSHFTLGACWIRVLRMSYDWEMVTEAITESFQLFIQYVLSAYYMLRRCWYGSSERLKALAFMELTFLAEVCVWQRCGSVVSDSLWSCGL